jgi:trans-aconitate methyltransferase
MEFDQFAGEYKQVLDKSVAFSGEESEYFAEYKARYLARLLGREFCGKVLDFGCGVGLLSGFLKRYFPRARIDGFDISRESIGRVGTELAEQGCFTSDVNQVEHDYEVIVAANVMHHVVPAERQSVVDGLAGRLISGGHLAVFEHNPVNPATRWLVEHCPFDRDVVLLAASETERYLKRARLVRLRRDYIVFMPHFLAWFRPLELWLGWLPLGAQYVVVGEKLSGVAA